MNDYEIVEEAEDEVNDYVYIPLQCSKCTKPIWMDTYIQNDGMCIDCNWDMKGYIKTSKEDGYVMPNINIMEISENVRKGKL